EKDFKILPIVMGQDPDSWRYLSEKLFCVLKDEKKEVLILASTDLSHYYEYEKACLMDKKLIDYIKRMDLEGLIKALNNGEVEMCGARAVLTLIKLMKEIGAKPVFLKYLNSGDTSGDKSRVVGYGAFVFVKGGGMLTEEDKITLLKIARRTLEEYLKTGKVPDFEIKSENLKRIQGAFVTLHKKGRLRGCIGNIIGRKPLWETVRDMAIESAVGDPRFPNVKYEELKDVDIEISVLSPLKKVSSPNEILLGKHGVLVRKGFNQGVYLPQVATETGWSKEEFLSSLCYHKAGLPPDAWKDKDTELYIFEAIVFDEKEFGLR
ncbi:MAG: TIGR00296 family protein, partial [Caldiserica bacterium]